MNKRVLLIVCVVLFVIVGGIVALATLGDRDNEPSEGSSSSSVNPAIYVGSFLPIIIAISQMQRPEYPAEQVFYQLRHAKPDKREKLVALYLSQRFRSGNKLSSVLRLEGVAPLRQAKSDPNDPTRVSVRLKDETEYTCRVAVRDKQVDGSGYGKWVIDDISGPGLG